MITEDYVSFKIAKLLKEKGFDEATHQYYKTITYLGTEANNVRIKTLDGIESEPFNNSIYGFDLNGEDTGEYACPTLQMTIKWLREVHGLFIFISPWLMLENSIQYYFEIREIKTSDFETLYDYTSKELNSVEKVVEAAIKYCLENLI